MLSIDKFQFQFPTSCLAYFDGNFMVSADLDGSTISYKYLFQSLARHSHVFPLCSSNVILLATPTDFYQRLLHNIQHAETRISIASLYIGTGPFEKALIDTIIARINERPLLRVQVVLDYSRGQRGEPTANSVTVLAPLLKQYPDNVHLFLFRVPQLTGLKAKLPSPLNETMGVSHAKVYLVDDMLVLSGANLSSDYFTNRQDRYMELRDCGKLSEFYHRFVTLLTHFSYQVKPSSSKDMDHYTLLPPVQPHDSEDAKLAMRCNFKKLLKPSSSTKKIITTSALMDTWAFPTIQFSPIALNHDQCVLNKFLWHLPRESQLLIASGYLNFPPFLSKLLEHCKAHLDIVSAAPRANGFFEARGVKGALPMAYSLLEQAFYERTLGRGYSTVMREFNRPNWTFHGKGMWWKPPLQKHQSMKQCHPELTIVGSSNFGQRSYGCDLESNLVLYTRNSDLQRRLQEEYDALIRDAEVVNEALWQRSDRMLHGFLNWKSGHWIRPITRFIAAYL